MHDLKISGTVATSKQLKGPDLHDDKLICLDLFKKKRKEKKRKSIMIHK